MATVIRKITLKEAGYVFDRLSEQDQREFLDLCSDFWLIYLFERTALRLKTGIEIGQKPVGLI